MVGNVQFFTAIAQGTSSSSDTFHWQFYSRHPLSKGATKNMPVSRALLYVETLKCSGNINGEEDRNGWNCCSDRGRRG